MRSGAHVTYLLRAPSYTPHEVDSVLAPAIAEELYAIKAVCGDTANRASVHQNLHLPAATHDAGEHAAYTHTHSIHTHIHMLKVVPLSARGSPLMASCNR